LIDRFEDDVELEGSVADAGTWLKDLVVVGGVLGVFREVGLNSLVEVFEVFYDPLEDLRRKTKGREERRERKVSFEAFWFRSLALFGRPESGFRFSPGCIDLEGALTMMLLCFVVSSGPGPPTEPLPREDETEDEGRNEAACCC